MEKNKKKVLLFIIILLIGIAILTIGLSFLLKNESTDNPNLPEEPTTPKEEVYYDVSLSLLNDLTLYNSVNTSMNSLYSNLKNLSLNIFRDAYIEKNNITKDNIKSFFTNFSTDISFRVKESYYGYKDNNYCIVFMGYTYLSGIDDLPEIKEYKYFIMHLNMNTYTYNLEIITQSEFNNIKSKMNYRTYEVSQSGSKFIYQNLSEDNLAKVYFNYIKTNLIANPDYVYGILTENTKSSYFNSLSDFKNYILPRRSYINKLEFGSYKKNTNSFVITDNEQNIYIITPKSVFDFNIDITFNELSLIKDNY